MILCPSYLWVFLVRKQEHLFQTSSHPVSWPIRCWTPSAAYTGWKPTVLFCFSFMMTGWRKRGKHCLKKINHLKPENLGQYFLIIAPSNIYEWGLHGKGGCKDTLCTKVRGSPIFSFLIMHSCPQHLGKDLIFPTCWQSTSYQIAGNTAN